MTPPGGDNQSLVLDKSYWQRLHKRQMDFK